MTQPPMSDQELLEFSGEHLMHELTMLWEAGKELRGRKRSFETSTLVDTFGLHLRNMIDFLYRQGKGDDVTADDFLDPGVVWNRSEPTDLTNAHRRANKELNHLTQQRKSGMPTEKEWQAEALLRHIDAAAKDFAKHASTTKLHPKVFEFLKEPDGTKMIWIGDNVTRSNVAAQTVHSVTVK